MLLEVRESEASKRKKTLEAKLLQKVKMTDEEIDELAQSADVRLMIAEILKYLLK